MSEVSGVLVLDKPAGLTSHDVVNRVRKVLGTRKVGHGGTLDPDATGVLVLCVGKATRILEYMTGADKAYQAEVRFGTATTTDDASGEVVAQADPSKLTYEDVVQVLREFEGHVEQRVPAYSAVHVAGKRAYDLARAGVEVDMPVRQVEIHDIEMLSFTPGIDARAVVSVSCSKGTYIRALCRDIGHRLGVPAHMGALRRTVAGGFSLGEAVPLRAWESSSSPRDALKPMAEAVPLPALSVDAAVACRLAQGQKVWVSFDDPQMITETTVQVTVNQILAAIAEVSAVETARVLLRPIKVFLEKDR